MNIHYSTIAASHVIIKLLYVWLVSWKKYAEKNRLWIDMSIQGVFYDRIFFLKYVRVQANDAQVQGVDAVNCTVLSNGMCHTRA